MLWRRLTSNGILFEQGGLSSFYSEDFAMAIEIIVHAGSDEGFIAWTSDFIKNCRGFALRRRIKRGRRSAASHNSVGKPDKQGFVEEIVASWVGFADGTKVSGMRRIISFRRARRLRPNCLCRKLSSTCAWIATSWTISVVKDAAIRRKSTQFSALTWSRCGVRKRVDQRGPAGSIAPKDDRCRTSLYRCASFELGRD